MHVIDLVNKRDRDILLNDAKFYVQILFCLIADYRVLDESKCFQALAIV